MGKNLVTWGLLIVAIIELANKAQAVAQASSDDSGGSTFNLPQVMTTAGNGGCLCSACGCGPGGSGGPSTPPSSIQAALASLGVNIAGQKSISVSSGVAVRNPYTGDVSSVYTPSDLSAAIHGGYDIVRNDGSTYVLTNVGGTYANGQVNDQWFLDGMTIKA